MDGVGGALRCTRAGMLGKYKVGDLLYTDIR